MRTFRGPCLTLVLVGGATVAPASAQPEFDDFAPAAPMPPAPGLPRVTLPPPGSPPPAPVAPPAALPPAAPPPAPLPPPTPAALPPALPPPTPQPTAPAAEFDEFATSAPTPPPAAAPAVTSGSARTAPTSAPAAATSGDDDDGGSGEAPASRRALRLTNTFFGPVGGIRVVDAGSGPVGTFRLSLMSDFTFIEDFLADGDFTKHLEGALSLSWTPHRNIEVFASYLSTATWNTLGDPELIQTLGDVQLGMKGFASINDWLRLGGDFTLRIANPVGDVGVMFRGTSFGLRGNLTIDLRERGDGIPFVFRANAQYFFDNSVNLIEGVENARYAGLEMPRVRSEEPRSLVTPTERFALGINRMDFVNLRFGFETPVEFRERVQLDPIVEWNWAIPVNRAGFVCPYLPTDTDGCLERSGAVGFPMQLTLGARLHPGVRGLSLTAAADVGLTGTRDITRELAPTAPYAIVIGAAYAYDPSGNAAVADERLVERVVEMPLPIAVRGRVLGTVVEAGVGTPVAGAVVRVQGYDENPLLTHDSGVFRTPPFPSGDVLFEVSHPDYLPGTCTATIPVDRTSVVPTTDELGLVGTDPSASIDPATGAPIDAEAATPVDPALGAPADPSMAADTGVLPEGPLPEGSIAALMPIDPESLEVEVQVRCELEARPRQGSMGIHVVADSGALSGPVTIAIEGASTASLTTDASGNARLAEVAPGHYVARVTADGYFSRQVEFDVVPRGDGTVEVTLITRPARPLARIAGRRIQVSRQVNFVTDSDQILPTSDTLLYEVLDILTSHPELRVVEIEGHTDDRGGADHNLDLSQRRAESVRRWLVEHGIAESRLVARGYGQTRPLVPNITPANRARNRRVQFTIRESE